MDNYNINSYSFIDCIIFSTICFVCNNSIINHYGTN